MAEKNLINMVNGNSLFARRIAKENLDFKTGISTCLIVGGYLSGKTRSFFGQDVVLSDPVRAELWLSTLKETNSKNEEQGPYFSQTGFTYFP